jgi:hypothetical protein
MRRVPIAAAGITASLLVIAATVPGQAAATPSFPVVADGLHNPRQLNVAPGGALYVAEAGQGGSGPCFGGAEGGRVCFGTTGSIAQVRHGMVRRVVRNLPSIGDEGTGDSALGPADVVSLGRSRIAFTVGLGTDPANRQGLPKAGRVLGTIMAANLRTGHRHVLADLARHEARTNPVDDPDSDPTGLVRAGGRFLATDSGGNTLVSARASGGTHTVAVFPDTPLGDSAYQAVPTDVVRGPDGAFYVTQLTGFPFPKGAANIYRVVRGHAPTVYASGLTNLTSLAFSPGGTLYAVQISDEGLASGGPPIGSLLRVAPDGSGQSTSAVASGLFAPYGVAIHRDSAYVTVCSVCATGGQVVQVPLH